MNEKMVKKNNIEKFNQLFFYILKQKFKKHEKASVSYKIFKNNELIEMPPVQIIYTTDDKKYWFAKRDIEKRNTFIFGKNYEDLESLMKLKALFILDFDKENYFNSECSALLEIEDEKTKLLIKKEYFKIRTKNCNKQLEINKSTTLKDNEEYIDFITITNKNFNSNLFEIIFEIIDYCEKVLNKSNKKIPSKNQKQQDAQNKFIAALKRGYSEETALKIANIKKYQKNIWYIQGKNGIEEYVDFYNACYDLENKKPKKIEKTSTIPKLENFKKKTEEYPQKNETEAKVYETCQRCGKKLPKNSTNPLCKTCRKKKHAAKNLIKLLKIVDSGIQFTKTELEDKGFERIEINDCIWTLQENNLLREKNGKYKLVQMAILCEFIKVYLPKEKCPPEHNSDDKKLSKTCSRCGKTLPQHKFSPLKNYCKDCEKPIKAAIYLKQLLNYVKNEEKFKLEDLKDFYPFLDILKGRIYILQELDLVNFSSEEEKYYIADIETCDKFLNDYYIAEEDKLIQKKKEIPKKEDKVDTEIYRKIINNLQNGLNEESAIVFADIELNEFEEWLKKGFDGIKPYVNLYNNYIGLNSETFRKNEAEYRELEELGIIDIIIEDISNGISAKKAMQNQKLKYKTLTYWNLQGEKGKIPFRTFSKKYKAAMENAKMLEIEEKNKDKELILKTMKSGFDFEEALYIAKTKFTSSTIKNWYDQGKKGNNEHSEFYKKVNNLLYTYSEKIEVNKIDYELENTENKKEIKHIVLEKDAIKTELIIKGKLIDDDFFNILNILNDERINVKKVLSTKIENYIDLIIELSVQSEFINELIKKLEE